MALATNFLPKNLFFFLDIYVKKIMISFVVKKMTTTNNDQFEWSSINPITANRPRIDGSEQELPRRTRATLAQLRSGWCHVTNHYMSRINTEIQVICPNCGTSSHDVHHLFNFPMKPTTLEISSLWTNPREAAIF